MDLSYEKVFNEDEVVMFKNKMPKESDIKRLKDLQRQISKAVALDTVEGYKLAAKLHKAKLSLINGAGAPQEYPEPEQNNIHEFKGS